MFCVGVGQICVCFSFPFGIEGGMWDVIVLIPDHCLSIYFHMCVDFTLCIYVFIKMADQESTVAFPVHHWLSISFSARN